MTEFQYLMDKMQFLNAQRSNEIEHVSDQVTDITDQVDNIESDMATMNQKLDRILNLLQQMDFVMVNSK